MRTILITGGAGFIGSHVVRRFVNRYSDYQVVNLDALTYAGNLANLADVEQAPNYTFVKGDIGDHALLDQLFAKHKFYGVLHLAAESHVDRSIADPNAFIRTNVLGTATLMNSALKAWSGQLPDHRFLHISTDEVFGSLGETGLFTEETPYDPQSPYSASKASSDHLVRAYHNTYGFPALISNCSNNYGPNHFPEKLIPLFIHNIRQGKDLPVYGKGENVRDWLYVEDHAAALDKIFHEGTVGDSYNVGGHNEWKNLELVQLLCDLMDEKLGQATGTSRRLIQFVTDRPGHDMRYAIDASKIERELGWTPAHTFEQGIRKTIDWYFDHQDWLDQVTSGQYQDYYKQMYHGR